jgi:hypothetical protein
MVFTDHVVFLIDMLNRVYKCLRRDLQHVSDEREVYRVLFNIHHYLATGLSLSPESPLKDVRFRCTMDSLGEFFENAFRIHDNYRASLGVLAREMYNTGLLHLKLRGETTKTTKYILLCDGMSMTEALYIAYRLRPSFIGVILNPGGITEMYKLILEPRAYFEQDRQITLNTIAQRIAEELGAEEYYVFREFDERIHSSRIVRASDAIDLMYSVTLRLANKLEYLKRGYNATILVLSDHGYDVIPEAGSIYRFDHHWRPRSLSILSPVLVI